MTNRHEAAPQTDPTPAEAVDPTESTTDIDENTPDNGERTTDEQHEEDLRQEEIDNQEHGPEQAEAREVLHGVRFVYQLGLEGIDSAMRKGEKTSAKVEDKTFAMKDYYLRHRIESVTKKHARYAEKSKTAIFGFRRRKYARKMRLMKRRLDGLHGFHETLVNTHNKKIGIDRNGKPIDGEYDKRRDERRKALQRKINLALKVESGLYEDIGAGRKMRRVMKYGSKLVQDKEAREKLKALVRETSTVAGLEKLGQGEFHKRLMEIPIVRQTIRDAMIRIGGQFAENNRDLFDGIE